MRRRSLHKEQTGVDSFRYRGRLKSPICRSERLPPLPTRVWSLPKASPRHLIVVVNPCLLTLTRTAGTVVERTAHEIRTPQTKLSEAHRRPHIVETIRPAFAWFQGAAWMGMGDESKESRLQSDLLSHDIRHSQAAPPKGKTGGWGCLGRFRCSWIARLGPPLGHNAISISGLAPLP
jgi:hypothetical protein